MSWTGKFAKHFLKSVSEGITDQQERMRKKEDLEDERDWQLKTESRTEERNRAAEERQFGRQKELGKINQGYTEENAKTQHGFRLDEIEERHLNSLEQSQKEFDRKEELTEKERKLLVTNIKIAATGLLKSENYGYTDEEIEFLLPHIEAAALAGDTNYATKFKKTTTQEPRVVGTLSKPNDRGELVPVPEYSGRGWFTASEFAAAKAEDPTIQLVKPEGATKAQENNAMSAAVPGATVEGTVQAGQGNEVAVLRGKLEALKNSQFENVKKAAQKALNDLEAGNPQSARDFLNSSRLKSLVQ